MINPSVHKLIVFYSRHMSPVHCVHVPGVYFGLHSNDVTVVSRCCYLLDSTKFKLKYVALSFIYLFIYVFFFLLLEKMNKFYA